MFLNLIMVDCEGVVRSFKTIPEIERRLQCEIKEKETKELLTNSLTDRIAYVKIVNHVLTISESRKIIRGR